MNLNKVLVHHTGSLGDTIVTIPALEALRKHFGSNAHLYLLHDPGSVGSVGAQEVLRESGLVDAYLPYHVRKPLFQRLVDLGRLWWTLVRMDFRAVASLVDSRRPAHRFVREKMFFWFCGIPKTIGFSTRSDNTLSPNQTVPNQVVLRLERLYADGITRLPDPPRPVLRVPAESRAFVKRWLASKRSFPDREMVALCPGTNMTAKQWPLERFLEVGAYLKERGFEIVTVGGPDATRAANAIGSGLGQGIDATAAFSVLESAALFECCRLVVTVDTGPMHLAAAVGIPCIVLMNGRDLPGRWDPAGDHHIILRHPVACCGCQLATCPVEGHPCMTGIGVADVRQAIDEMLER